MRAAAHDLRNLISVIHAQAQFGAREVRAGLAVDTAPGYQKSAAERFAKIESLAADCDDIIGSIFFPSAKLPPGTFDLNHIARKIARDLENELARLKITLACDLSAGTLFVTGDGLRMMRALLNVCLNARDALARKPDFLMSPGRLELRTIGTGQSAMVSVNDTGVGMDDPMGRWMRLNESTPQSGHGYGLLTVKQTVEAIGGEVHIESARGVGTQFVIKLPRVAIGTIA